MALGLRSGLLGATCPYCVEPIAHGATVCKSCQRDVALVTSLKEANQALEDKIRDLEAELAELRERQGPAELAAPVVVEPPKRPPIVDMVAVYVILPILLLVLAHYLLIIRLDTKLIYLRIASIALPALFGVVLELKLEPRWLTTLGMGIVVGFVSVFGMATLVHFTDGDSIMPDSAIAWRETLEYITSISLSYLLGGLIVSTVKSLRPPATGRRTGQTSGLAAFIASRMPAGRRRRSLEEHILLVVRVTKLAVSVSTAAGAVYTGLKSVL